MGNTKITGFSIVLMLFLLNFNVVSAGTIKGKVTVRRARKANNIVVYIDKVNKEFPLPKNHVSMDQKNLTFIPHILPVLAGTTVDFSNSDDVLHNVFTPDKCADKFNLGTWAKGEVRSYTFKNAGCVSVILCNVHPEMEAYVVVLQNPYYFKTSKDGEFIIEDVPEGKYVLKTWHEKFKGASQEVKVPEKGEIVVNLKMKR